MPISVTVPSIVGAATATTRTTTTSTVAWISVGARRKGRGVVVAGMARGSTISNKSNARGQRKRRYCLDKVLLLNQ